MISFVSLDDPQYTGGKRLTMECTVQNTDTFDDSEMNALGVYQSGSRCNGSLYDAYVRIYSTA